MNLFYPSSLKLQLQPILFLLLKTLDIHNARKATDIEKDDLQEINIEYGWLRF